MLALGVLCSAHAVEYSDEYAKLIKTAETVGTLGPDLFGDQISHYTGGTEFVVTDVSLPGNDALPVQVGRRLSMSAVDGPVGGGWFADWELEIPHLRGTFATNYGWQVRTPGSPNARCTVSSDPNVRAHYAIPPTATNATGSFGGDEYWRGNSLYVPGQGSQDMLVHTASNPHKPTAGGPYYWVTNQHWYFSCLPATANGVAGEAFLAHAPDGTKYYFDTVVWRPSSVLTRPINNTVPQSSPADPEPTMLGRRYHTDRVGRGPNGGLGQNRGRGNAHDNSEVSPQYVSGFNQLYRIDVQILPSKIVDRFGNQVTYTYTNGRPTRIAASDGRALTLTYDTTGRISTVSDGMRTWTYGYASSGARLLTSVTLPDNSKWTFSQTGTHAATRQVTYTVRSPACDNPGTIDDKPFTLTFNHPSGATGAFVFRPVRHGRSGVSESCADERIEGSFAYYPIVFDQYSVASKTLSGPGLAARSWNYTYGPPNQSREGCTTCPRTKTVEITGPDNSYRRLTFGNHVTTTEGKLLKTEIGTSASSLLRVENDSYLIGTSARQVGINPQQRGDTFASERVSALNDKQIVQAGVTFRWHADSIDPFGAPLQVTRSNSLGSSSSETTTYFHQTAKWVIGQVDSVTHVGTGRVIEDHSHDPNTALKTASYAFGKLQATYTYNADGTLRTVADGKYQTTTLGSWYRGVPRRIDFPTLKYRTAVVNAIGRITSVTDELGYTTSYGYDTMGRLSSVTYPTGDSVAWSVRNLTFQQIQSSEYGLPAGHWRHTTSHGNYRQVVYYDALLQPVLTHEFDAANSAATSRFVARQFDSDGREVFVSYPESATTSWTGLTVGERHSFDVLGRPTRSEQDSELGVLATTTAYLSGFKKRVTNPRSQATTYTFQAFDQPTDDAPIRIDAPAGLTTVIDRDPFGKPTAITRSGTYAGVAMSATRRYVYDVNELLCKRIDPESGATLFDHDAAGNLAWSADGLALNMLTCDRSSVPTADRTLRTYDAMNRVTAITYPSGTQSISYGYEADGALSWINTTDGINWSYTYNRRRLLTSETSSLEGMRFSYGYDALGHLSTTTYPNTMVVAHAPNALGQPTRAGSFATGASYYPNGALKAFTYGNGIVRTNTQNARRLTSRSRDTYGTTAYHDFEYAFDPSGNITAITDRNSTDPGRETRSMTYDGLDRLITANATNVWGTGRFTYDPLDNLREADLGSRQYRYTYASNWRLSNIRTPTGTTVWNFGHDARGNQTSKGAQTYTFDRANRITAIPGKVSAYYYDGHGRRMAEVLSTGAKYSLYTLDGVLRGGPDSIKGTANWHVHLGKQLVATSSHPFNGSAATVTYHHADALGSPVADTTSTRAFAARTYYEPYGAPSNRTFDGPGYTGHLMDGNTGLVYMQQRYYDPIVGRFLSPDPMAVNTGTAWNFNRYNYAANNPHKFTDPDGRIVFVIVPLVIAAAETTVGSAVIGTAVLAGGLYVSKQASDVIGAYLNESSDAPAADADARETGSYTNTHASGKTYDGKGDRARSQASGRRVETETGDQHVATDWTPASSERNAFKQESERLDSHGGPSSEANYNKIESPGKKMRIEDSK